MVKFLTMSTRLPLKSNSLKAILSTCNVIRYLLMPSSGKSWVGLLCAGSALPPPRHQGSLSLYTFHTHVFLYARPAFLPVWGRLENMSAFKRKRGGPGPGDKKAKKVKFVADDGKTANEVEPEQKDEVTVPAPVSMVSLWACILPVVSVS